MTKGPVQLLNIVKRKKMAKMTIVKIPVGLFRPLKNMLPQYKKA
jgi:hypothetical protein